MANDTRRIIDRTNQAASQLELELVQFKNGEQSIQFNIDLTAETVWATATQIADLFERDSSTISDLIYEVFDEKELDEASSTTRLANDRGVQLIYYNLDVILSVGYRVNSPKAANFRKWTTQTLKSFITDGFVIDERRLRDDNVGLNKLAAKIRELRSDEKTVYSAVRECFKEAASDYDSRSPVSKSFYARLQDKFLYAITGQTSSQIVLDRAQHTEPNMGLQSFSGNFPKVDEAKIGKNYLDQNELYTLHVLCEQFLLFAESRALRGKEMTMAQLDKKFDELLHLNEYPVFKGYKDFLKDKAVKHAMVEYACFSARIKQDDVKKIS